MAFDWLILPERRAQPVTAGFKWAPEILAPRPTAIANAAIIKAGDPVKEIAPIRRDVPKNSVSAALSICIVVNK